MSVLCLSLVLSLLFTAFTRVNCSIWATAHTQSCVSLSPKKKKEPVFTAVTAMNGTAETRRRFETEGGNLPITTPPAHVTIFCLKKPTSPRDDLRRQARRVTPPADTELCSRVNQQVQMQAKQTVNIRRWKSVTPTFKAGHGFIKRVRQKRRGPLLWKEICRWGSCLWDMLNVWLTRKLSSSNTGRENRKKERQKEALPNLKKEPCCVCVKCKLVQNDVRLTIPSSHYCCITVWRKRGHCDT